MLSFTFACVIFSMSLMLISTLTNKLLYDRLMAVNCFTNYTVVLIVVMAVVTKKPGYIDIALIYGMVNFVATIAFLQYVKGEGMKGE